MDHRTFLSRWQILYSFQLRNLCLLGSTSLLLHLWSLPDAGRNVEISYHTLKPLKQDNREYPQLSSLKNQLNYFPLPPGSRGTFHHILLLESCHLGTPKESI